VDALPKSKTLSCPHATFTSNYWYDAGQKAVYSTTTVVLKDRMIPVKDYDEARHFFEDVAREESEKIVIRTGQ
jgi:hypothetical protein